MKLLKKSSSPIPKNSVGLILGLLLSTIIIPNALGADALLSWTANTESDIAGYKVYYGTASRNYGNPVNLGNVTSYTVTGLSTGTYYFALTAYDIAGNESGYSNEVSKAITSSTPPPSSAGLSINFEPIGSTIVGGFQADNGLIFDLTRGFGWDILVASRERNFNSDKLLDTFVYSQAVATWNYNLSNGNYLISLASGDAGYDQGPHRVEIEGIRVINDVTTTTNDFVKVVDYPIAIADGQLTVKIGGTTGNTMLNYIMIKPTTSAPPPSPPPSLLPAPKNVMVK